MPILGDKRGQRERKKANCLYMETKQKVKREKLVTYGKCWNPSKR